MKLSVSLALLVIVTLTISLRAQTTLGGDHIVTGDLSVGDASTKGKLEVNGEIGNAAAPGINVIGDGGVVFEGTLGTGKIPASGAGIRMLWYPKKAAFRAGEFTSISGLDTMIGMYSTVLGRGVAYGSDSFAAGNSGAVYEYSTALGGGFVYGAYSFAVGGEVDGDYSFTFFGNAYSDYSVSLGYGTESWGRYSTALGGASAYSMYSLAIGRHNVVFDGSSSTWNDTDPVFVVGNGTGDSNDVPEVRNRNAFVIYKNGNVKVTGAVEMPRQGDILMGEFGNP